MDREIAINRDALQRRIRHPAHRLRAPPVGVRLIRVPIGELRHAHRRHRRAIVRPHALIHAQRRAPVHAFFELRDHFTRQLLAHEDWHRILQRPLRVGLDELLQHRAACFGQGDTFTRHGRAHFRGRRDETLRPVRKGFDGLNVTQSRRARAPRCGCDRRVGGHCILRVRLGCSHRRRRGRRGCGLLVPPRVPPTNHRHATQRDRHKNRESFDHRENNGSILTTKSGWGRHPTPAPRPGRNRKRNPH